MVSLHFTNNIFWLNPSNFTPSQSHDHYGILWDSIGIHVFPSLLCSESPGLVPLFFVVYPFKRYESLLRVPLPGAQKVEALKVADSKELWVKRNAAVSQGGQGTERDWQREEMKIPTHTRTEKRDPLSMQIFHWYFSLHKE